jgi:general secretion pathway protein M
MKAVWQRLALREQQLIIAGGTVLALIVGYFSVVMPVQQSMVDVEREARAQETLLKWMDTTVSKITLLQNSGTSVLGKANSQSLLSVISQSLQTANLVAVKIEQIGGENVSVTFNKVAFDDTLRWLITIWQQYGIVVSESVMRTTGEPGEVQAVVVLTVQ